MLILVYAGPNGTGKSTLFSFLNKELDLPFINPDMIAKEYFGYITDEEERYRQYAIPFAEELKKELMNHGKAFSFETVLSHRNKIEYLHDAREQGYEIYSIFIGTDDPAINIMRVKNRVSNGGHNVPEIKIINRYYRTMNNLPELLNLSEEAVILDNSGDRLIEVFCKSAGKYYFLNQNAPKWVDRYVIRPLTEKGYITEYPGYLDVVPCEESLIEVVKFASQKLPLSIGSRLKKINRNLKTVERKPRIVKLIKGKGPLKKSTDEQEKQ